MRLKKDLTSFPDGTIEVLALIGDVFCRVQVLISGMRIPLVSKLVRGRTSGYEVISNLRKCSSPTYSLKGLPVGHGRGFALVPNMRVGLLQAEVWKVFVVPGQRFMMNIARAPSSLSVNLPHGGFVSLFRIRRALRLIEFDSLCHGIREFSYQKCHSGICWSPAVFVSLADKKGQVYFFLHLPCRWVL